MDNTQRRSAGKLRRTIALLSIALVLIGVFILGISLGRGSDTAPTITNELISQQLSAISELATLEYRYTNMGKFENQVDFYGWKVPLTKKSFIVAYDGIIRAGIDTAGLQTEVHGKRITITLPPTRILSHEILDDSLEIFDESQFIFNPLQISDYTGFTADQRGKIEQRALENGLLTQAQEKAEDAVRALMSLLPAADGYELILTSATPA